ncbi:MAG: preprotein translocase subunit Sec61beta [Nitrososphaerales archaeon]
MSKRKREAPLPASSAGLLRFFEEESKGPKVRPEVIIVAASLLVVISLILKIFLG